VCAAAAVAGCSAEQDLMAYFGSPAPSPGSGAEPSPAAGSPTPLLPTATAGAAPSPTLQASPTARPTRTASPTASPSPGPTATPLAGPTGRPSPTRPPNLADFSVLRERTPQVALDRLLAQPQRYAGELLYFDGRVLSVDRSGGTFRARVRSSGGPIHLVYDAATYWGQPLVRDDRIRLVGYFRGLSDAAVHGERVPVIEVYDLVVRFS
jgi:hypothetical protein